jgi:hypothetical protein
MSAESECAFYIEELVEASHLCLDGKCIDCTRLVNKHKRRPAQGNNTDLIFVVYMYDGC